MKIRPEINNGNGKGKTDDMRTSISQLLMPHMNGLIIKGKVRSITKPRTVNTKTGALHKLQTPLSLTKQKALNYLYGGEIT